MDKFIKNRMFYEHPNTVCEGCVCHLLDDKEIVISKNVFHNNVCSIHYKYLKTLCEEGSTEIESYKTTGRNFFVDFIEFNVIKFKIRDATISFLTERLNNYVLAK